MFVKPDQVEQLLLENTQHNTSTTIMGNINDYEFVQRKGKWKELHYKRLIYPPFPEGSSGYVVTRDIAVYVARNKELLHNYQGEDVSLGIWMNEAPFSNTVTFSRTVGFVRDKMCFIYMNIVIGHAFKPKDMLHCIYMNNLFEKLKYQP